MSGQTVQFHYIVVRTMALRTDILVSAPFVTDKYSRTIHFIWSSTTSFSCWATRYYESQECVLYATYPNDRVMFRNNGSATVDGFRCFSRIFRLEQDTPDNNSGIYKIKVDESGTYLYQVFLVETLEAE